MGVCAVWDCGRLPFPPTAKFEQGRTFDLLLKPLLHISFVIAMCFIFCRLTNNLFTFLNLYFLNTLLLRTFSKLNGIEELKVVPTPTILSTYILPPFFSTNPLQSNNLKPLLSSPSVSFLTV